MLTHLKVSQFAIIEQIEISFGQGLNILSGETGAGKSVLLRSLALLMGEKADSETVRTGYEQATVEGSFELSRRPDILREMQEHGIPTDDETLIVRRVVSRTQKGRVYLNGVLSPLNLLRDLIVPMVEIAGHPPLIEMTGQHENRHLLTKGFHLDLLDQYCGTWPLREKFSESFRRQRELLQEIETLNQQSRDRTLRLDFLVYQRDEIQAFDPKIGEENELENEMRRLRHASRLQDFAALCEQSLYNDDESLSVKLHGFLQRGGELSKYDETLKTRLQSLQTAQSLIKDVAFEMREYGQNLQVDPERLDELEERFTQFRQLQKKYGATCEEILNQLGRIESEIEELSSSEEKTQNLSTELESLSQENKKMAEEISKKRAAGALLLTDAVNEELEDLNMKGLEFFISVETVANDEISSTGQDLVEFQTRTSRKDEPKPLAKFASGGELSRILLSIKQVVGESRYPRTYLFDEVDTGVSGPTAEKVGRKLKAIAKDQQVICVTHLPQVAACGDLHFHIEKSTSEGGAFMNVTALKKSSRVEEIARLISGAKITDTSRKHARQLLETGR